MFKFILIVFLISYVVYKVGGFFFRVITLGGSAQRQQRSTHNTRRPSGSNVNVQYPSNGKKKDDFKGGEYVDYEEVKD